MNVAAGTPAPCPRCRGPIRADSFTCRYCGAPVAFIWEDCRQACYFLRLAAVSLLASLITGVIAVVVTGIMDLTGLNIRDLAIVSAIIAVAAAVLWKFSDTLNPPPEPYQEFRDGRYRKRPLPPHGEGASSGSADKSGLSAG